MRYFYSKFLLLFIVSLPINAQIDKNEIIGIWNLDKEENKTIQTNFILPISKSDTSDNKLKKNINEIRLEFKEQGIVEIWQNNENYKSDFKINKRILKFGNREYEILKLDSDSLIISNHRELAPTTYYYHRTDNNDLK